MLNENIFRIIPVAVPHLWIGRDIFSNTVQFGVISDDAVMEGSLPGK